MRPSHRVGEIPFELKMTPQINIDAITGETIIKISSLRTDRVSAVFADHRIEFQETTEGWSLRADLGTGAHRFTIEACGRTVYEGVVHVRLDYLRIPEQTLRFIATTHTCMHHTQKWN